MSGNVFGGKSIELGVERCIRAEEVALRILCLTWPRHRVLVLERNILGLGQWRGASLTLCCSALP